MSTKGRAGGTCRTPSKNAMQLKKPPLKHDLKTVCKII